MNTRGRPKNFMQRIPRILATPLTDPTDRRIRSRRKHPRALVDWPVTIVSPAGSYQGKAANISRGGALVHLSQQLTVGDNVRLAFEVPDYQDVIVAKGEILRSFPLKQGEQDFSYGAALQFTEISEENSKYFTGNIAPEWKEEFRDTGPIINDAVSQNVTPKRTILPWILVSVLLFPFSYFIYDFMQRRAEDHGLNSHIEMRLSAIEEQIASLKNSMDSPHPFEDQLDDLQDELVNIKIRLPARGSLEEISQQLTSQNHQIENINQKIGRFDAISPEIAESTQQERQEEENYYVVESGDNLFRISSQNKITIQELKEINRIGSGEVIFPGQKLKIK